MKSKQIQLNNKVGLYMRLSKDDERQGESLSIENQRNILTKYAQERGWTVIDEYVDDGYSGTNFDRPQVQRLLEDAKTGKIDTIIVKDLSRFGRNYIFVGQYVEVYFTNGRAKSKIELKQPYQCKVRAEKLLWNLGFY